MRACAFDGSPGPRYTGGVQRVFLLDQFDSFTHNVRAGLEEAGAQVTVFRPDQPQPEEAELLAAQLLVLGPGPGHPGEAATALALIRTYAGRLPILGICLGHQCLAVAYGGEVDPLDNPVHGKSSLVTHDGRGCFEGLPNPLEVGRYHSLEVVRVPPVLEVCARTESGTVMALRHRELPLLGLQFHPDSFLSPEGAELFRHAVAGRL